MPERSRTELKLVSKRLDEISAQINFIEAFQAFIQLEEYIQKEDRKPCGK